MYLILTIAGISLLLSSFLPQLLAERKWKWTQLFWSILIFLAIILPVGFAQSLPTPIANIPNNAEYYYVNVNNIYSLRTMDSVQGSFVLGCGEINGITYYVYYTQDSDGGYSINKIEASKCKIYMDRDNGGIIEWKWARWNTTENDKNWGLYRETAIQYEIHIPYGSLTQQYKVE